MNLVDRLKGIQQATNDDLAANLLADLIDDCRDKVILVSHKIVRSKEVVVN